MNIEINNFDNYLRQTKAQEYFLIKNHWRAIERACTKRLTDQLNDTYKYNAEYIYIENERTVIIEYFWNEFKKRIDPVDFAYLMTYISSKNNNFEVSRKLQNNNIQEVGKTEETVRRKISNCQKTAKELLQELGITMDEFKKYFIPEIGNYFASSTSNVGYPFEHFMNLPVKKEWQDKFGIKFSKKNKSCLIPEYLQDCNLHNCQCIICTDTNNCRRKDAFPENDRTEALKRSRDKITAIADNIIANTPASAYDGLERIYSL